MNPMGLTQAHILFFRKKIKHDNKACFEYKPKNVWRNFTFIMRVYVCTSVQGQYLFWTETEHLTSCRLLSGLRSKSDTCSIHSKYRWPWIPVLLQVSSCVAVTQLLRKFIVYVNWWIAIVLGRQHRAAVIECCELNADMQHTCLSRIAWMMLHNIAP
jgi:hypothetical protein